MIDSNQVRFRTAPRKHPRNGRLPRQGFQYLDHRRRQGEFLGFLSPFNDYVVSPQVGIWGDVADLS